MEQRPPGFTGHCRCPPRSTPVLLSESLALLAPHCAPPLWSLEAPCRVCENAVGDGKPGSAPKQQGLEGS